MSKMIQKLAIGVDLGGTRMRACIGDGTGRILRKVSAPVPRNVESEQFVRRLISMIRSLLDDELTMERISSVGVGAVGPLDRKKGQIKPVNLPFAAIPLRKLLSENLNRPVVLLNDAQAGVLGEHLYGEGRKDTDLVYITLSTGIGGGAIANGTLLVGKDGNAVAAGHQTISNTRQLICGCGGKGHWEAYCSGRNLPNFAGLIIDNLMSDEKRRFASSPILRMKGHLTAEIIFREAKSGDPLAMRITDEVGRLNAIGISNIVNLFDPSLITLGGSLALKNQGLVLQPLLKYLKDYLLNAPPRIMFTSLGEDVVLVGALAAGLNPDLVPSY